MAASVTGFRKPEVTSRQDGRRGNGKKWLRRAINVRRFESFPRRTCVNTSRPVNKAVRIDLTATIKESLFRDGDVHEGTGNDKMADEEKENRWQRSWYRERIYAERSVSYDSLRRDGGVRNRKGRHHKMADGNRIKMVATINSRYSSLLIYEGVSQRHTTR